MSARPLTIEDLKRWRTFGAGWRIVEMSRDRAVFDLCACTGEAVERHESRDRQVLDYLLMESPTGDDDGGDR